MNIFLHVLYTWLLANFIQPFVWILVDRLTSSSDYNSTDMPWPVYLYIFFFSFLFSIPAVLIAWVGNIAVLNTNYSVTEKFFLWYLIVISAIVIDFILIILTFIGWDFVVKQLLFVLPALVSAFLAITIRYKYFLHLNNIYKQQQINKQIKI